MKTLITFILLLAMSSVQAQQITRILDNYSLKKADLVLFAFGMERPLKIGEVDDKGKFSINLAEVNIPKLAGEDREMYMSELGRVFSLSCGDARDFGQKAVIPAVKGGYVALWANNEWSASFFLVSDKKLKPWIEDEGYNAAIKASYFEIIYVEEDVSLNLKCKNEYYLESGTVAVQYTYDLNLKKGLNWVEYNIEEIYPSRSEEKAPFPSKVRITNLKDPDSMIWVGNYFY
jgi:hypothetical protein